jgi:VIT1/CCC1 family predicted Fe2+/Mn2+ transporter
MMKQPLNKGVSFGLTSGAITTLGLMVGLHSETKSAAVVLGGILTIAVADAFSDALGIHISEEGENQHAPCEVWRSTVATFLTKFVFAMSFLIPILLLPLSAAIIVSVTWGMSVLAVLSYLIAKNQRERPWKVIGEHLGVAALVIIIAHFLGHWIASYGK